MNIQQLTLIIGTMKAITTKKIKLIILLISCLFSIGLNAQKKEQGPDITSLEFRLKHLEDQLEYCKKFLASRLQSSLLKEVYELNNIDVETDTCIKKIIFPDYSGVIVFQAGAIYLYDENADRLLEKWRNKDYFSDYELIIGPEPLENEKKGNIRFIKVLDFYVSDDLNTYIDSVRVVETRRLHEEFKEK